MLKRFLRGSLILLIFASSLARGLTYNDTDGVQQHQALPATSTTPSAVSNATLASVEKTKKVPETEPIATSGTGNSRANQKNADEAKAKPAELTPKPVDNPGSNKTGNNNNNATSENSESSSVDTSNVTESTSSSTTTTTTTTTTKSIPTTMKVDEKSAEANKTIEFVTDAPAVPAVAEENNSTSSNNNSSEPIDASRKEPLAAAPQPKDMSSGIVALVMAIVFSVTVVIVYISLLAWRRYLEYRYGNRELLVNDLEFDTNDLRHFEL